MEEFEYVKALFNKWASGTISSSEFLKVYCQYIESDKGVALAEEMAAEEKARVDSLFR